MAVVSSQTARSFVQTILNGYEAYDRRLTVSREFTSAGFLNPPPGDYEARMKHEDGMMKMAQSKLLSAQYRLDPLATGINYLQGRMADFMEKTPPPPQYIDPKSHFFSHIFQIAYGKSDIAGKRKIIAEIAPFHAKLNSLSFRCQRLVFKIEGVMSRISTSDYAKVGVCVVIAVSAYFSVNKLLVIAVQFFRSPAFTEPCLVYMNRLPIVMITTAKQVYEGGAYVVSSRVYKFFINSMVQRLVCGQIPALGPVFTVINLLHFPAATVASTTGFFLYQRSIGPDARAQEAISESLKELNDRKVANELLSEGMKAYQVWMYLVQEGPRQGLFQTA
jgi:hypothetical protein